MRRIDDRTTLRLRSEFEVIPLEGDTVLLRSPVQGVRVGLDGVAASDLAALLAGLDGTRPLGSLLGDRCEIQEIVPLLDGLVTREILEVDGAGVAIPEGARFFSHFHDDPLSCWRRLTASRVLICGTGAVAEAVARALRGAGVGEVRTIADGTHVPGVDANGTRQASASTPPRMLPDGKARRALADACKAVDLVVVCPAGAGAEWETTLNDLALATGFAWLPVRVFAGEGFVGPLFVPGDGPCHTCFRSREEANWADPELTRTYMERVARCPTSLDAYGQLPGFAALIGHWAAIEATKYLSRFTVPALLGNVLRIDFVGYQTQVHRIFRLPRCTSCSPLARRPGVSALSYAEAL
jgi:ribosomal protein S12 methylthiotransferase accessory factor